MKNILKYSLAWIFLVLINIFALSETTKVIELQKIGEIKEGFSCEEPNFFWWITGLCCDSKDNLFVIDSGHSKIFKFGPDAKFIASFGREGQGPGEFMGRPRAGGNLRLSFGNDGHIYVFSPSNQRISIFSIDGQFLKQFTLPERLYDSASVNSKGEIYLLSRSKKNLIDCFDKNFQYKFSLLDMELHLQFPYKKPSSLSDFRYLTDHNLLKLMTKKDELIVISNNSLEIFVFDRDNKLVREFKIEEKDFVDDFKKRLKRLKDEEWIWPFHAFLDCDENLCLVYPMRDSSYVILRYKLDGTFLDKLKFPEKINLIASCCDSRGRIYSTKGDSTEIGVYAIKSIHEEK